MAIVRQTMIHDGPGGPFEGLIAWEDEVETPRPGVMIVPNVLGRKAADDARAEDLARLGYVGFVADVFGQGKRKTRGDANVGEYMGALDADRALLRERLRASLAVLRGFAAADPARLAAIGYCFGGKCVLDMARAGLAVRGVVSLHGVYDPPGYAVAAPIRAQVLVCHGWDDPLGPPDAVARLSEELTAAGADWRLLAFGNAGHAFTDASAIPDPARPGFGYEERADRRSWQATQAFLAEVLAQPAVRASVS